MSAKRAPMTTVERPAIHAAHAHMGHGSQVVYSVAPLSGPLSARRLGLTTRRRAETCRIATVSACAVTSKVDVASLRPRATTSPWWTTMLPTAMLPSAAAFAASSTATRIHRSCSALIGSSSCLPRQTLHGQWRVMGFGDHVPPARLESSGDGERPRLLAAQPLADLLQAIARLPEIAGHGPPLLDDDPPLDDDHADGVPALGIHELGERVVQRRERGRAPVEQDQVRATPRRDRADRAVPLRRARPAGSRHAENL